MRKRAQAVAGAGKSIPQFWTQTLDGAGATVLTYAIRGGMGQFAVAALGVACVAAGVSGAYWLVTGGEMSIGGAIFILLVPGGAIGFGIYCLNIAWWARTEYAFTRHALTERDYSIWGNKTRQVNRGKVSAVGQHYSPPESGRAAGTPGRWATILEFTNEHGAADQLAFEGMGSVAEARWLGPWVAEWAGIPLKRGFSDAFQEADEKELPQLDD